MPLTYSSIVRTSPSPKPPENVSSSIASFKNLRSVSLKSAGAADTFLLFISNRGQEIGIDVFDPAIRYCSAYSPPASKEKTGCNKSYSRKTPFLIHAQPISRTAFCFIDVSGPTDSAGNRRLDDRIMSVIRMLPQLSSSGRARSGVLMRLPASRFSAALFTADSRRRCAEIVVLQNPPFLFNPWNPALTNVCFFNDETGAPVLQTGV